MEFKEKLKELIDSDDIRSSFLALELVKNLDNEYIEWIKEYYTTRNHYLKGLCSVDIHNHPGMTCLRLMQNRTELFNLVKECDHILNKCVETIENTDKTGSE